MAKLCLLLWKNWLLQLRQPVVTAFELLLPTLFACLLLGFRTLVDFDYHGNITSFQPYSIDAFPSNLTRVHGVISPWELAYCPNISIVHDIVEMASKNVKGKVKLLVGPGFVTEKEMEDFMKVQTKEDSMVLGAVVFYNSFPDSKNLPLDLEYAVRLSSSPRNKPLSSITGTDDPDLTGNTSQWFTNLLYPVISLPGPRHPTYNWGGVPGYMREGFLTIQHAVDKAIVQLHNETMDEIKVEMIRYPYPPYEDDAYVIVVQSQLPALLMLSLIFTALNIVKDVVFEKEKKLKESMKMMGLANWLHWVAWFIKYFILLLIAMIICTILFTVEVGDHGSVINNTDPTVLFVFLLIYAISTVTFCFAISVFFSVANTAAAGGGVIWFLTYVPYLFIQPRYQDLTLAAKLTACLLPNTAMAMGSLLIGMFEGTGQGVQWSNINQPVSVDDDFTFLHVLVMLLVDSVIACVITWYIEAVFPGDYGIPQPWYFFLTSSYWCRSKPTELLVDSESTPLLAGTSNHTQNSDFLEADPTGIRAGISIRMLNKVFNKTKVAVAGISLEMYEGQITALLGHNGAGKTTTLSMLTGLFPPSAGTALVNGYDIRTDMQSVRSSLGLCPQHDILFDKLTVEEHLIFFTKLKGFPSSKVKSEVDRYILALGLEDKRKTLSKSLSGGMKRKLSVGIALVADSKVVMLDEPTSGMDPSARRFTWDLLQQHRAGRTILLTTHFMDEADLLGDRIAIMADGQIRCCGSSLFLKKKYGVGYHMTIVKLPGCDVEQITDIVRHHVPDGQIGSNIGAELSYILPSESSCNFEALFTELEMQKTSLGIGSYGASVTTMEEVFLKVGENADDSLKGIVDINLSGSKKGYKSLYMNDMPQRSAQNSCSVDKDSDEGIRDCIIEAQELLPSPFQHTTDLPIPTPNCIYNAGLVLAFQQFYAMFLKKVLHSKRNFLVMVVQILVPSFFTLISIIVVITYPSVKQLPPLTLTLEPYKEVEVPYSAGHHATNLSYQLASCYANQFKGTDASPHKLKDFGFNETSNYLVTEAATNHVSFNSHNVITGLFQPFEDLINVTSFFNNQPYHAIAASLNAVDNAILKTKMNDSYSLTAINYPLPQTIEETMSNVMTDSTTGFAIAFNLLFGMAFLASSFVVFLIKESSTKSKHIQFVSGVSLFNFWLSTFAWDIINFLICIIIICIMFLIGDIDAYSGGGRLGYIFLLMVLYGWAIIPLMYLFAFLFSVPSTGFVRMTIFNIITGLVFFMTVEILSFPSLNLMYVADDLTWIFMLSPNFCLGIALADFYKNYETLTLCESMPPLSKILCKHFEIYYDKTYIGWNDKGGIGRYLVFLAWEGIVFISLVFLIETKIFRWLWYQLFPSKPQRLIEFSTAVEEDEDVAEERSRIELSPLHKIMVSDTLVVKSLRKVYSIGRNEALVAVDDLSFGVSFRECFGLLGNNGAGKTSTFKMLTGDEIITSGTAYVDGYNIKNDLKLVQQKIGYCPQFDALIDQMTGRETLTMYARLRGVPECYIPKSVNELMKALLLEEHSDKLVKAYSGGNKRKLSTAVALVGDPPIVFLDEPSTGMDPVAKRLLWDAISRIVADGSRCVVLTSHSMEECEALCTRLAIMVNGQLKCIGSTQHLKHRFGQGYTLLAKISYTREEPNLLPLKRFIEQTFKGSKLKDEHQGLVHYHIQDESLTWAKVFGIMERAKTEYNIEDYSVSQTTLEQVFINFVRSQRDVDE
ncbi:phospholipid-transporting ATPase ABCA3-like [Saccoglossus kowalevskii]|uniref:ATP-binding cassette sub-family A member 3-like n=1 Tax=Saccoglossus kowalevskii TaxID=10224 RepID=A0ABM0GY57_SACKO|nr:PREDICTED: ATP-binding cassette sub-family A member 3-like [Saccoglossus kowalevskii]